MKKDIQKAINILKQGGIVIFPTDTAFAIGCRVDNKDSIKKLFSIRNRPLNQPMSILVDTVTMAKKYVLDIPQDVVDNLIEPYWPGALTIVLQSRIENVSDLVRGGGKTVGVRIPDHQVARTLIREAGVGILGPSANFHGEKTPYRMEDLDPKLISLSDFVIKGECNMNNVSTVIDCSTKKWKILREGAIKIQNYNTKIKNKIILSINTTNNKEVLVKITINNKENVCKEVMGNKKAQAVLPIVEKLIKKNKIRLQDIEEIEVNTGQGSFTGIRVGIAIANALAFSLKIPVNNKKIGDFAVPYY